jgi:hypothetical protein
MSADYPETWAEAQAFLEADGGRVPCSRYGRNSVECAPWAWCLYRIMVANGCDESWDALDSDMGLVVNDHDDVLYMILGNWHDLPEADQQEFDWIFDEAGDLWISDEPREEEA